MAERKQYQQGDKVYRARVATVGDGKPRIYIGEATVTATVGALLVLDEREVTGDNGWALGFCFRLTPSSVYPSRRAAAEALVAEAAREVQAVEGALAKRRAELAEARSALAVEERLELEQRAGERSAMAERLADADSTGSAVATQRMTKCPKCGRNDQLRPDHAARLVRCECGAQMRDWEIEFPARSTEDGN